MLAASLLFTSQISAAQPAASGPGGPGTLSGVVTNGTSVKPAAGSEVTLILLAGGMEEEARTKTDARGRFTFKLADMNAPHLVSVRHQAVDYFERVKPGSSSVEVTVYDAAREVESVTLTEQAQIYQAEGTTLAVREIFTISNASFPPRTVLNERPFEFYLPEGATLQEGEVTPPSKMALKSSPVPGKEKNKYAFVYPLRPGETHFDALYSLPYSGTITLHPKLAVPAQKFFVVTPKSMEFSSVDGAVFKAADTASNDPESKVVDVRGVSNATSASNLAFRLTGSGMLPRGSDAGQQTASSGGAPSGEDTRPGGGLGVPNERPDPLHSAQFPLLVIMALFLAGGGFYVYSSSRGMQPANPESASGSVLPPARANTSLLEALKEEVFQLEADRVQGKISQKDYQDAKAALDRTMARAIKR